MDRYEVKYWDQHGIKRRVYVIATTWKEAEAMVNNMANCDVDGSVLLGKAELGEEPGVLISTVRLVTEDD